MDRTTLRRTARTYARKAAGRIVRDADGAKGERRWLSGYEAADLLRALLQAAHELAPLLNDEDVDEMREDIRELAATVRSHALAAKLERVEGRAPEEAAAFLAAAKALRER